MKTVAVLTGDLIKSRKLENDEIEIILNNLPQCFENIKNQLLSEDANFEFYRGDSFQIILHEPELAIKVAFIIRAFLRSLFKPAPLAEGKPPIKRAHEIRSDARISIGIGTIRMQNDRVVVSQGEAFELSGLKLDQMEKESLALSITTPWKFLNEEFVVNCLFADVLIDNWTETVAESICRHLLYAETQKEHAKNLNITQPAVGKRLIQGNMKVIEAFINRSQNLIQEQCKNK